MIWSSIKRIIITVTLLTSWNAVAEVSVLDAYARAVPPGQMNSASFMMLKNRSDQEVALVSASSDVAKFVELHNHINNNGVMKMRQVEKITIPATGETSLEPGGYHIMLIGLKQDLNEGDEVALNLNFSSGDSLSLTIPVKKVMMGMKGHHHHH